MNISKHTVTIPVEDYTELLEYKDKATKAEDILQKHSIILYDKLRIMVMPSLSKIPKGCSIKYDDGKDTQICYFEY